MSDEHGTHGTTWTHSAQAVCRPDLAECPDPVWLSMGCPRLEGMPEIDLAEQYRKYEAW